MAGIQDLMRSGSSLVRGGHEGRINVGPAGRVVSAVSGGALLLYGIGRGLSGHPLSGLLWGGAGALLVRRGASGHCAIKQALGLGGSQPGMIQVEKAVTINRAADDLFSFFRSFENLPRIMTHLKEVQVIDPRRSHWVAKAPGGSVEWDAEIINEEPGRLIVWRSLPGADVESEGSVRFTPLPGRRGTVVRVNLRYAPPAGKVGALIASLFGEEPGQQIEEDLRRFKQVMETGEVAQAGAVSHRGNGHRRGSSQAEGGLT